MAAGSVAPEVEPTTVFGHAPFHSTVRTKIETSGRLSIPSAYRHAFVPGRTVGVIRARRTDCLMLYTQDGFDAMVDHIESRQPGGMLDPATRQRFYKFSSQVTIDRQYRFVIPPDLREQVGLGEDVVLAGAIETIEIWPADRFHVESERADDVDLLIDGHSGLPTTKS